MKKVFAFVLVLVLLFTLVACGEKGVCELCGAEGSVKTLTVEGESGKFCNDCYDSMKSLLDLASSFGG